MPLHQNKRINSIDMLRGLVMVIMALDHVRDYFHDQAFQFDPLDLSKTYPALFFTRWITHFCAPVFVFLSGTSAWLSGRNKSKGELSRFLFTRGLWLIFLELTLINFGWFFNPHLPVLLFGVIWAIGFSMVVLAGLIFLPMQAILAISAIIVFGHNFTDGVTFEKGTISEIIWSAMHTGGYYKLGSRVVMLFYPALPWVGIMGLGYCLGPVFTWTPEKRHRFLLIAGSVSILLFVLLRWFTNLGEPDAIDNETTGIYKLLSFINTSKYPPSLLYTLMTLGPALLFMRLAENGLKRGMKRITVIGRVPMFYYLLHIFFIHILAMFAAWASGYHLSDMVLTTWVDFQPELKGFGFPLWLVYIIWISIVLMLYPFCKRYNIYRSSHKEKWWLSYL